MAESKTVNSPVPKVGLDVIKTYLPSELVTGVPADEPSTAAVVKTSAPSATFSAVTAVLHSSKETLETVSRETSATYFYP